MPMSSYSIKNINKILLRDGYVVVPSGKTTEMEIMDTQMKLTSKLGTLSEHNPGKEDFFWKISSSASNSELKTYSEHSSEAELHTDSQYRIIPEQFFSLSCVTEASCGGGMSILLDSEKIIADLKVNIPEDYYSILYSNYPIIVPDIFRDEKETHIMTPIFGEQVKFRFRYDTIKKRVRKTRIF